MKQFTMSQYPNRLELQYDKDKYLDKLIKALAGRLIELEEVAIDDDSRCIWRSCGDYVGGD